MKKYNIEMTEKVELGRFEIILDTIVENGARYPYSYVSMKKSVGVLPICGDKVILINQYRHAVGSYELEIPGGGIENGNPEETARKELLEETGYMADKMIYLGEYYPSPGSTDEITYLYAAECHFYGESDKEPLEYIDQIVVSKDQMVQYIRTGKIRHGMALVAWLKYEMCDEG